MKKFILILLISMIVPFGVYAVDYDITDFMVDSYVQENGDLKVSEIIVLDGEFNGYERDLIYGGAGASNKIYNGTNITDLFIRAKKVDSVSFETFADSNFTEFERVDYANNGEKGKYILSNLNEGYRIRMYYYTSYDKTAFNINYTVKDAVVLYNDVAELNWNFIPTDFEDTLNNANIRIHLPGADESENFRAWAHGNLIGKMSKVNNNSVQAQVSKIVPGEYINIRLTFDTSLLNKNLVLKKIGTNSINEILSEEKIKTEEANALRDKIRKEYNLNKVICWLLLIGTIIMVIYVYIRHGKSPKSGYDLDYNREFIDDYNVEVIDYLMNRKITPNAMSASIMNLIYKKKISTVDLVDGAKGNIREYTFILEDDNLSGSEKILIDFLFGVVGGDTLNESGKKTFTSVDLKKYAKSSSSSSKFLKGYNEWHESVMEDVKKEQFFESSVVPKTVATIYFIAGLFYFSYAIEIGFDYFLLFVDIIIGVFVSIWLFSISKKTPKGSLHYDKWKAFKHFLDDFGSYELKDLPEVVLWEKYLVYATVFGLADKVQKSMNVKIEEINPDSNMTYTRNYINYNAVSRINSSVAKSVSHAISNAYATSSRSSANGSGGGFSGGGCSGGGGGGGRGF